MASSPSEFIKNVPKLVLGYSFTDHNNEVHVADFEYWKNIALSFSDHQGQYSELVGDETVRVRSAFEAFYSFLGLTFSTSWAQKKQMNNMALSSFRKLKSLNLNEKFINIFKHKDFIEKDGLVALYCQSYFYTRPSQNDKIMQIYDYLIEQLANLLSQYPYLNSVKNFQAIVYHQKAYLLSEDATNIDFFRIREMFDKSIECDNQFAIFYCNRGQFFWKFNFINEALADLNSCINIDDKDESYYVSRGCIQFSTEKRLQTKFDFERAIAINPNSTIALLNLATTFEALFKDPKNAIKYYEKAYLSNPKEQQICLVSIARILLDYYHHDIEAFTLLNICIKENNLQVITKAAMVKQMFYESFGETYLAKKEALQSRCATIYTPQVARLHDTTECSELLDEFAENVVL